MKPLSQFDNRSLLDRAAKLGKLLFFKDGGVVVPSAFSSEVWDVQDELQKRGLPTNLTDGFILPTDPTPVFHDSSLIRYGKKGPLEALRGGIVSFGPASSYEKQPNAAQRDDELGRTVHYTDRSLRINGTEYPAHDIKLRQPIKQMGGDYLNHHLLSLSHEESVKLQRAFEAEGYVVINDIDAFFRAIETAVKSRGGGWMVRGGDVKYYNDREPCRWGSAGELIFSKSLDYAYQYEFKVVLFGAPKSDQRETIQVDFPPGLISEVKSLP